MALNFGSNLFQTKEQQLFSYNFVDMLSGQGYADFYLGSVYNTNGAEKKVLFRNIFESMAQYKTGAVSNGTYGETAVASNDYDFTIINHQRIGGNALIELLFNLTITRVVNSVTGTGYLTIAIKRDRGGVVTTIGSAKTQTISLTEASASSKSQTERNTLEINCTTTDFIPNDILRINITGYITLSGTGAGNGSTTIKYYTDPKNRLSYVINYGKPTAEEMVYAYAKLTDFRASIPFKIELN